MDVELQCPKCGALCVVVTNGSLRCNACGEQKIVQGGIRLNYGPTPAEWIKNGTAN